MEIRTASRAVSALILAQMIGGYVINFVIMAPLFAAPGFLVNGAAHAREVAIAVLAGLVVASFALGIAIIALPIFRPHSQTMAIAFVALAGVGLAVAAVENVNLLSMLSLSQSYAGAAVGERERFEALRVVAASARNWAHYVGLIVSGCTLLVFYATLFRFALVPRVLAAFGLLAVALQIVTIARTLFGQAVVFPLLAPLGLCQLLVAIWLVSKGFRVTVRA